MVTIECGLCKITLGPSSLYVILLFDEKFFCIFSVQFYKFAKYLVKEWFYKNVNANLERILSHDCKKNSRVSKENKQKENYLESRSYSYQSLVFLSYLFYYISWLYLIDFVDSKTLIFYFSWFQVSFDVQKK